MPRAAGAAMLLLILVLAGCSGASSKPAESETPEERERRSSRPGPTGGWTPGPPQSTPSEDENLNTTVIAEFRLRIATGPLQNDAEAKDLQIVANNTTMRFTSTFYTNSAMPLHSGQFLTTNLIPDDSPALVAAWAGNGTRVITHTLNGGTIYIGGTGYRAQGTTRSVVDLGTVPADLKFSTRGWGDIYIAVVVEVVNGPATTTDPDRDPTPS